MRTLLVYDEDDLQEPETQERILVGEGMEISNGHVIVYFFEGGPALYSNITLLKEAGFNRSVQFYKDTELWHKPHFG